MYKWSLQAGAMKDAYLKANPKTAEEAAVKDQQKVDAVTRIEEPKNAYTIDRAKLENIVEELSAIFKDYKDIYDSSVAITGQEMEVYKSTTDGVVLKEPLRYASLVASD